MKAASIVLSALALPLAAAGASPSVRIAEATPPDWRGERGLVFAADRATLAFECDGLAPRAEMRRAPDAPFSPAALAPDPASPARRWLLELPETGWYDIRVADGGDDGQALTLAAAVLGEPIPERRRMKSVFGIWTVHGDPSLVRLAGARWNRRMTSFRDVTREQAATFGGATSPTNAVPYDERDGLAQIGVFSFGMPLWTMDMPPETKLPSFGNPFFPATDWSDVARAVAAYARTHALPRAFSIYNEPLAHFKGKPAQLADYARAVRAGLRAADPSFRVGGPGLYSIRLRDLSAIEAGGLLESLDFLDLHAYVGGTPPEGEFVRKIDMLREWLSDHGRPDMPVALTEFGWTAADGTWQPPVDRATQARYVARSLALAWSRGVDALIYFALDFRTKKEGEAAFSLIGRDGRPEAGYAAFAAVSRHFAASEPMGEGMPAPGVHLVAGRRDGRIQFALWREESADAPAPLTLPWPVERATSLCGSPLPPADEWTPSPDPVFFESPPLDGALARMPAFSQKSDVPLRIAGTAPRWPASDAAPHLEVLVDRPGGGAAKAALAVEWENGFVATGAPTAGPEGPTQGAAPDREAFAVSLPWRPDAIPRGRRLRGVARLSADGSECGARQFDVTILAASPDQGPDTGAEPWADFSNWAPWGWPGGDAPQPGDCRAAARLFHGESGLRIEIAVEDDEHCAASDPARLWESDSVQIALDMDFGKPWEAGFAGAGSSQTLGGHRVFEFSIGGPSGSGTAFLERSYDDTLPAGTVRHALDVVVSRDEASRRTRYDALVPWSELGAATAPPRPGAALGIAIAVNDADPGRGARRRALRLFGGIVESKDPETFGPLFLR